MNTLRHFIRRATQRLRRWQLAAAIENLNRIERDAAEAADGQRARIIDLQTALDRTELEISAADVTRSAERALKRRLLA